MRRLVTVIVTAYLAGAAIGLLFLLATHPPVPRVVVSGTPLIGGPFTLTDQSGKTVTDRAFRGRYMLVVFGYTNCPDICPAELQVVAAALDELGAKARRVVPIFITIDPKRDTPAILKAYLGHFGKNFVGLTGTEQQIASVAKAYKAYFQPEKIKAGSTDQDIDHSSTIYLMGPDGKYVDHVNFGVTAPQLAQFLQRYL